jgi:hypothetical protein
MNYLAMFLKLLPSITNAVTTTSADLSKSDHKQAIEDGLMAVAGGVAIVAPVEGPAAIAAASLASFAVEGVYELVAAIKARNTTATAPVVAIAATATAPVDPATLTAPVTLSPAPVVAEEDAPFTPGPGLHATVAA